MGRIVGLTIKPKENGNGGAIINNSTAVTDNTDKGITETVKRVRRSTK